MANLNWKSSKNLDKKQKRFALACRRCGAECSCSDEENDAGGPA
jgi:transcription elongation factor Elf1